MSLLPIRLYPDPVLRQPAEAVANVDEALRSLVEDMVETMHAAPGVGLAAPQIGRSIQLAVVDVSVGKESSALRVLLNPEIIWREGQEADVEGCLSIPEYTDRVVRPARVRVQSLTLAGDETEFEAEGYEARAVCHEIDHLNGILFIDRLRGLRRERGKRFLKKLERAQEVVQ